MKVSDLLSVEPISIHVSASIDDAGCVMRESRLSHLAVTDHNGVRGLLGVSDILLASRHRARAASDAVATRREAIVRHYMAETVCSVGHCAKLLQAVDIMLAQRLTALPVTYSDGRVGAISAIEVLRCFKAFCALNPSHPIATSSLATCMTARGISIDVQEKLGSIVPAMIRDGISHLPVTENGILAGIITDHDLRRAVGVTCRDTDAPCMPMSTTDAELTAAEIMTSNPIALGEGDPIFDAASLMASRKIGAVPVVDDRSTIKGIVTTTNILTVVREVLYQAAVAGNNRSGSDPTETTRSARILSSADRKSPAHAGRTSGGEAH